jgi:glutamate synthase domain-containing protein 2
VRWKVFSFLHIGLINFVQRLRDLSGGKPVGFKLCVGHPAEVASIVQAMLKLDITPGTVRVVVCGCESFLLLLLSPSQRPRVDFVTIDGGEGGTGAAPPEYSNHMGTPLIEGMTLVHNLLIGAGLRDRVKIISAGKVWDGSFITLSHFQVVSGFSLVKQLALGADLCNCARGMMFALGCIQALKCNTNKCPSGVGTQDPELTKGS